MHITFGHFSAQGIRPTMEDRVLFEEHLTSGTHTYTLCAIMDGHGGEFAAQFVQQHLKDALINEMNTNSNIQTVFVSAFEKIDASLCQAHGRDASGSTCVAMLIDTHTGNAWIANVGDSRCIAYCNDQIIPLSVDQKADRPDETKRIRESGGFVINRRVMGQLAISRAFGDFDFKDATRCAAPLVIATPETKAVNLLTPAAELFASNQVGTSTPVSFAVLACDGLFDVLTDREVCDFVAQRLNDGCSVQAIAEMLVQHALVDRGSKDNVSVCILCFSA